MYTWRQHESGFSMVEMAVVLGLMTVVTGAIFMQLGSAQKRAKWEADQMDAVQEAREFADQIVRDLHHAGYPGTQMYQAGVLMSPPTNDYRAAAGLVKFSYTELLFEGDVDGAGNVSSVRYTLQAAADGNCPCSLRRSQTPKFSGNPMAQLTNYTREVDGVVNSAGSSGSGTNGALQISGTTQMRNGSTWAAVTNDTLYGPYAGTYMFRAFDANGDPVAPCDLTTSATALHSITTIQIVLNVIGGANTVSADTRMRPAISVAAIAHIAQ
jgi:type II secretory pathway pseudopilin PulG